MTQWVYKTEFIGILPEPLPGGDANWAHQMNILGDHGWEAFCVIPEPGGWCVLFKSPREADSRE